MDTRATSFTLVFPIPAPGGDTASRVTRNSTRVCSDTRPTRLGTTPSCDADEAGALSHHVEPHGEREVVLEGPGGARQRHQGAEDDGHPHDAPDVVVPPVRLLQVDVDLGHAQGYLHGTPATFEPPAGERCGQGVCCPPAKRGLSVTCTHRASAPVTGSPHA